MRSRLGRFATGRDATRPDRLEATWVDLVDIHPDDRVLLVDPGHRRAEHALRQRTRHVEVVWPGGELGTDRVWDLVCVDDVRLLPGERHDLRASLSPHGRWVQVCDNAASPLRFVDRWRGRARGATAMLDLGGLLRSLNSDLEVQQLFGLLRSSMSPVTAFDVLSEQGVATTVSMSLTHVRGLRGVALRLLVRLDAMTVARLTPAWLVIAAAAPRGEPDARRIIGKVANRDSSEIKLVRGDPPTEVERHSARPVREAELEALRDLDEAGFDHGPRVLGNAARSARYSWMEGEPLLPDRLDDEELVAWTARAAGLLAELQNLTRRPDGSVVVHGDFWLGNLLVRGEEIVGLVDWNEARRGSPEVDRRFLMVSHARFRSMDHGLRVRLEAVCDEALPGSGAPDPTVLVLGRDADRVQLEVPTVRFADDPDGDPEAHLQRLLGWAGEQPTAPVLLLASPSAVQLASRHRDRLGPAVRFLLPEAAVVEAVTDDQRLCELLERHDLPSSVGSRTPAASLGESYHAYAEGQGAVIAEFVVCEANGSSRLEITAPPDVLALGRRVVERLGLRGASSVWMAHDQRARPVVDSVELYLGPRHLAGAASGVDIAALCYADLAGLPRPRGRSVDLRSLVT